MKWLLSLILVLLAIGTLRVVGCGDEGPECIYPYSYAAGTVRDPTCDDENECTEGRCTSRDTCFNESAFRDGEPCDLEVPEACHVGICEWGSCERTERPCGGVFPHDDCARGLRNYDCDPNTGVVECTWSLDVQGQSCCLEYGSFQRCELGGWCIDGACVTSAKGYPRDCTDRDDGAPCDITDTAVPCRCDGEPCDIEKTLGLCWKGKCAALDCGGLCSETRWWRHGYDVGVCDGPIVDQCRTNPLTGGPPGWTCDGEYYGAGDGCDCGCGIIDPDCTDGTVGSCDYCGLTGSCNSWECPGDIDPAQNWLCLGGTGVCGNGVVEHGELCDRDNLRGLDCTDLSFTGGTLVCTMECTFDTSGCTGGTGGVGGSGGTGGAGGA